MALTIFTDSAANLPMKVLNEYNIKEVLFEYVFDNKTTSTPDCDDFDDVTYYSSISNGTPVSTSQINPQTFIDAFTPELEMGNDVLYISMSSGISGTYRSSVMAVNELRENYPNREIHSFDTRAASLGEGLCALYAAGIRDEGLDIFKILAKLIEYRDHICQYFTVDDLMFLKRTGRVTMTSAVVGTMLRIKPILRGNSQGKIVTCAKATGRRSSLKMVAQEYIKRVENPENQIIGIAHAMCPEDADVLIRMINESDKKPKGILLVKYEPMTGSHVGPGALALFFQGQRDE